MPGALRLMCTSTYRRDDKIRQPSHVRNPDVYLHHGKNNPPISHQQKRDADSHADATKGFPNVKVLRPVGRSPVIEGGATTGEGRRTWW